MTTFTYEIHYSDGRPMDMADVVETDINAAWNRVKRSFPTAVHIEFVSSHVATAAETRQRW